MLIDNIPNKYKVFHKQLKTVHHNFTIHNMSSTNTTANSTAASNAGESKQSSSPIQVTGIARGVKRGDSTERSQVVPPFLIAGFTGDRSGSMSSIDLASAKGLYNWLKETTENSVDNGQTGKIFVTTFDNQPEKVIEGETITDVHKKIVNNEIDLDFCHGAMKARGSTKLYDTAITDLENIVMARDNLYENLPPAVKKINPNIAMIWAVVQMVLIMNQHILGRILEKRYYGLDKKVLSVSF